MTPALIGDIGATNARFALLENDEPTHIAVLPVADHPSLRDAIQAFLKQTEGAGLPRPRRGALAVAGPVTGDYLSFTNHPWSFSIAALTRDIAFDYLKVVNDFVAQAMAAPRIGADRRRQVGSGTPVDGVPIAIIGPGTGLGVSIVVPVKGNAGNRWVPLAGEGGHATLPAVTDRERALIELLYRSGRKHVSAETFICGAGLSLLHSSLSTLNGVGKTELNPPEVTDRALKGTDPVAVEAVAIFCALLGTVAGNLALTAGSRGGLFIAGGIVPKLGGLFDKSDFRERFVAKGRMRTFLEPIPTYVITEQYPAFLGLAELLREG
ncbi:MAG TPA: glucokinase [Alphaproteobacteria bacterium]|nr:glucokinase [Alphaproteobacteria bacterium]